MKTIKQAKVGKATIRIVETNAGYSGLVIMNGSIKSRINGTDHEEVWRELHAAVSRSSPSFFGFDGARARFLRIFRDGFSSPAYRAQERDYKMLARTKLTTEASLEKALEGSGLGERILSVFRATNLLSPFESIRIQEMLRGPNADAFIRGAAQFAMGDTRYGLLEMERALKPHDIAKWTAVTYLPFLWRPETHMFLKPMITKDYAERVGHRFANDYSPRLDGAVYSSLLDLANATESEISDLEPADRIDIQSFIWVVGHYDVESEAGLTLVRPA